MIRPYSGGKKRSTKKTLPEKNTHPVKLSDARASTATEERGTLRGARVPILALHRVLRRKNRNPVIVPKIMPNPSYFYRARARSSFIKPVAAGVNRSALYTLLAQWLCARDTLGNSARAFFFAPPIHTLRAGANVCAVRARASCCAAAPLGLDKYRARGTRC